MRPLLILPLLAACDPERVNGPSLDLGAPEAHAADWHPMYRHDVSHRGVAATGTGVDASVALAWRSDPLAIGEYTASKSSPAVDDTQLYVGLDSGHLVALDRATGEEVWRFATRRVVTEATKAEPKYQGIHGSPAVDDRWVYVGDYDGWLYAVDKVDGALVWERKLGGSIGASPVVHEDLVWTSVEYPIPDGRVRAVDRETGEIVWTSPYLGDHPHGTPTIDTELDMLYVGANNGRFVAFDLVEGRLAWERDVGGEVKSTAAVADGRVYITSWGHRMDAFDAKTGNRLFRVDLDDKSMSSPTVHEGRVWFGSHDRNVRCVDAETGEVLWTFAARGSVVSSPTLVPDTNTLFVGSRDDHLYVLDATTGEEQARHALTDDLTGVPTVVDGSVFVYDDAGVTWRFDLPTP